MKVERVRTDDPHFSQQKSPFPPSETGFLLDLVYWAYALDVSQLSVPSAFICSRAV